MGTEKRGAGATYQRQLNEICGQIKRIEWVPLRFYFFFLNKISRHAAPSSENVTGQAECSQSAVICTPSLPLVIAAPAATLSDRRV